MLFPESKEGSMSLNKSWWRTVVGRCLLPLCSCRTDGAAPLISPPSSGVSQVVVRSAWCKPGSGATLSLLLTCLHRISLTSAFLTSLLSWYAAVTQAKGGQGSGAAPARHTLLPSYPACMGFLQAPGWLVWKLFTALWRPLAGCNKTLPNILRILCNVHNSAYGFQKWINYKWTILLLQLWNPSA